VDKYVTQLEFYMRCCSHCNSDSSAGRCCRSTATVTDGTGTSSACTKLL